MSDKRNNLYTDIIKVTADYLGLAAERFIDRQISSQLRIDPSQITSTDLLGLINWIRLAISLLTEDTSIVNSYCDQLVEMAKKHQSESN